MIIGVLNQKGGVGKTTLSLNLGFHFGMKTQSYPDRNTLLIDTDKQGSLINWDWVRHERHIDPPFYISSHLSPALHKKIGELGEGFDYVIIDGPPRDADIMRSIIVASDVILIPVTPSPYDVWATETVLKLIDECNEKQLRAKPVKAAFVLNRRITNTAIGRDVIDALKQYPVPVFGSCITQRVIFAESAAQGLSVYEVEPNGPAAREIDALADELMEWMNDKKNTNK